MTKASTPPWEKPAPKDTEHHHLTQTQKKEAKERADDAGRPYPNMVDNMAVARKSHKK